MQCSGADELEQHRDHCFRNLLRYETTDARKSHEPAARNRVGEPIGESRADPGVLIAPEDQRRLRQRGELGVLQILVVLNWLYGAAVLGLLTATIVAPDWTMTALGIDEASAIRRL